jgi:uncharacterized membrane protein YciS (DUF1049 family)
MKSISTFLALIVVLILAIALRNWSLVTQPVAVDLFVTTVDVSLSLLLMIGLVIVAIFHFATIGRLRIQAAIESRDLHRELDRARRTAETAEMSRIADLRAYLDREIPQIELKLDLALERLDARVPNPATATPQR